jgi:NAD(P)-dependent dehydrogenase (short-subunit alcohol dehydrogenase family)
MSNSGKRVAWVTGGSTGIGEAGAIALAGIERRDEACCVPR